MATLLTRLDLLRRLCHRPNHTTSDPRPIGQTEHDRNG